MATTAVFAWLGEFPADEVMLGFARTTYSAVSFVCDITTGHVVPGIKAIGSTTYNVTVTYVTPIMCTIGTAAVNAVTTLVKGKPQPVPNNLQAFTNDIEPAAPLTK